MFTENMIVKTRSTGRGSVNEDFVGKNLLQSVCRSATRNREKHDQNFTILLVLVSLGRFFKDAWDLLLVFESEKN